MYVHVCERCGKEVPATLAGFARAFLRSSARIDGKARALCPECAESRPSIEVRCPACRMREIWHHLPKGGDRCRWCGHLFEDFTYRKVGPGAEEDGR